ncbi:hypothetical protein DL93DRAFT_2097979 [Clavulina sp. PMI_390]|nr:hypothetical protein DL93DRAFT_2097979 [Clavulina sp. PMI_390]
MDHLPFEILTEVMLWGAFSFSDFEFGKLLWYRLTLTSVSARWRHTAISTGSLWSRIKVDIEKNVLPGSFPNRNILSMLEQHLRRSRAAPLSITLYLANELGPSCKYSERNIWLLLKPETHRIRHLHIYGRPRTNHILPLDGHYPALRTISVNQAIWDSTEDWKHSIFRSPDAALNLTSLQLTATNFCVLQNIPSAKLTSFTLLYWHLSWNSIHQFLLQSCQLVRCVIRGVVSSSGKTYAPVLLPHVTFLEIEDPQLFRWLSVPNLKEVVCYHQASTLADGLVPYNCPEDSDHAAQFCLQSLEIVHGLDFKPQFIERAVLPFWKVAFQDLANIVIRSHNDVIPLIKFLSEVDLMPAKSRLQDDSFKGARSKIEHLVHPTHFASLQSLEIENCHYTDDGYISHKPIIGYLERLLDIRPNMLLVGSPLLISELEALSPSLQDRLFSQDLWARQTREVTAT